MAYQTSRNYADEITKAIAANAPRETVARLYAERNEKIASNPAHYDALGVSAGDSYGEAARAYLRRGTGSRAADGGSALTDPAGVLDTSSYRASRADAARLSANVEQRYAAAERQAAASIDRGTAQAVNEAARTLEDAQGQYQVQMDRIDADEARSRDNQALYAELRGDRGGIGAAQYDSIQNTAAQNRQAVYTARTQLAAETGRQIARLRAQGEYEKADAALSLTQQSLARLTELEKWAMEYNMKADQFNAGLDQWQANYHLQLRKLDLDREQWERQFDYNLARAAADDEQWALNRQDSLNQKAIDNAYRENTRQDSLRQKAVDNAYRESTRQDSLRQKAIDNTYRENTRQDSLRQKAIDNTYRENTRQDSLRQKAIDNAN